MSWISNRDGRRDEEGKGILWKLPVVNNKDLGKLGPGFGAGVGCGVGFGIGLFGGVCFGFGAGFPGLQIGFGVGGGCGIGIGFGYGIGRGVGYDEHKKYSNAGKMFGNSGNLLPGTQLSTLLEDLGDFTTTQIACARKQISDSTSGFKKKLRNPNRGPK
ncbi:hypothetical protein ZOSMA_25G01670 [Zostera marina]|uniref:Uncharacterized protein n=1 Tax=Zostera marina TaxID=29655 RepID=A0A0K9PFQ0_ZOSMR|nr:hypothetical protein ZOSMA_25G01670 [Zostera marina]